MNSSKTVVQKELRKNQKTQRLLSDKDDQESMRKLEHLMKKENEIIQKMEHGKQRKEQRLRKLKEKYLLESMTFEETCEYFKGEKVDITEDHSIPNTREARIHRKKVIQGINEYKMNRYFVEQVEMRMKLKAFLESIESDD
jgi:hypothetical protein